MNHLDYKARRATPAGRSAAAQAGLVLLAAALVPWPGGPAWAAARDDCLDGHGAAAVQACNAVLETGARELVVYLALGAHLNGLSRYREAAATYRQALQHFPNHRRLSHNLEIAQSNLQEQSWASQQQAKSAAGGSDAKTLAANKINRIRCLKSTGEAALRACDRAIAHAPDDAALHAGRGDALRALGREKPALQAYRQAQRLDAGNPVARAALASLGAAEPPPALPVPTPEPAPQASAPAQRPAAAAPQTATVKRVTKPEAARAQPKADPSRQRIVAIQTILGELGLLRGAADGLAGPATRRAAEAFQRHLGESASAGLDQAFLRRLRAAREHHRSAEARLREVRQLQGRGHLSEAFALAGQSLDKAPWHASLRTLRGVLDEELRARRTERAQRERQRGKAAQLLARARAELEQGALASALELTQSALRLVPDQSDALALRSEVLARRNTAAAESQRLAEALRQLDAARAAVAQARRHYREQRAELALGAQQTLQSSN